MKKGGAAEEHHLKGVSRNISPKKKLVRIMYRTDEKAHNKIGSSIDNDTICNERSDALCGT